MSAHIDARFNVTTWDENPFDEGVGVNKLTRAVVAKDYSGDVQGTSTTEWLMAYSPDKTATFVGMERIKGAIADRHGSLVLMHVGTFDGGKASAELTVVSGTDELKGVAGSGTFLADPEGSVSLTLDFP